MIKRFLSDQRGNVAIMFAGSMMMISALVGASVDYSRILNERQEAQNRLDASILAAASQYQEHGKRNKSISAGKEHFTSSLPDADPKKVKIDISNKLITAEYTGTTEHYFLSIVGSKSTKWKVEANIKFAKTFITDFALAIDVSHSMENTALIKPLRRHLTRFSESAYAKASPGDVSVSIVPFSNSVAFPSDFDRWLDPKKGYSQTKEFNGCFEYESILESPILETAGHANRIAAFDRRLQPKRKNIPFCPEEKSYVSFFHQSEQDLTQKVKKLTTSFGTNTAEGLIWARRILAPEWRTVFNQSNIFPRSYKTGHNKVMILLTDGKPYQLPTIRKDKGGTERIRGLAIAMKEFKEVCKQIKDEGKVDLYTIAYGDLMTESQRNVIRSCIAGNGRSFWANTTNLQNVFRKILAMNSELALSK